MIFWFLHLEKNILEHKGNQNDCLEILNWVFGRNHVNMYGVIVLTYLVIELILVPLTFQRSLYSLDRPLKASRSCLHCKNVSNRTSLYKLFLISHVLISTGLSAPVPRGRKGKKVKTQTSSFDIQKAEWLRKYNPEQLLQDEGYKKHIKHHCNK